jgi:hypothetical protein
MTLRTRRGLATPLLLALVLTGAFRAPSSWGGLAITPYLQSPSAEAVTVVWFATEPGAGELTWQAVDRAADTGQVAVDGDPMPSLAHTPWEAETYFAGVPPKPPFRHRYRVSGLEPGTRYAYRIRQGAETFADTFATAPAVTAAHVRVVFLSDAETEPESTGNATEWTDPAGASPGRRYLVDQTTGLAANLAVVAERRPDLVVLAGDLVESGGEQRDWDEFWRQLTDRGRGGLAARVPVLAVPGNHEYYAGPLQGQYGQPASERAMARYLSYFSYPEYRSPEPADAGRYYRLDYGPITLLALDVTNGGPPRSTGDTNFLLNGQNDDDGGESPGFAAGTFQYAWLETQLRDAQTRSAFTLVVLHHVPWSVGPHGWPAGTGTGHDTQSGVPVRALAPLFLRYGVDALIAGHDEVWERSVVAGTETLPDRTQRPDSMLVFDVGTAGDGLRGPQAGLTNPNQRFLVERDVPEQWRAGVLLDGGKHYGHLELDVFRDGNVCQAIFKPVYVFPVVAAGEQPTVRFERRVYDDVVTLTEGRAATAVEDHASGPGLAPGWLLPPYPNPSNGGVTVRYRVGAATRVQVWVMDSLGRRVRRLVDADRGPGVYAVEWDGRDSEAHDVASGVYLVQYRTGSHSDTAQVVLSR